MTHGETNYSDTPKSYLKICETSLFFVIPCGCNLYTEVFRMYNMNIQNFNVINLAISSQQRAPCFDMTLYMQSTAVTAVKEPRQGWMFVMGLKYLL